RRNWAPSAPLGSGSSTMARHTNAVPLRTRIRMVADITQTSWGFQIPCCRRHTGNMYDFDVLVLGSGPGGQKAAIAAAKLGRRVGIIERRNMIGGVCLNTGPIPSHTLPEAVLYLTPLPPPETY